MKTDTHEKPLQSGSQVSQTQVFLKAVKAGDVITVWHKNATHGPPTRKYAEYTLPENLNGKLAAFVVPLSVGMHYLVELNRQGHQPFLIEFTTNHSSRMELYMKPFRKMSSRPNKRTKRKEKPLRDPDGKLILFLDLSALEKMYKTTGTDRVFLKTLAQYKIHSNPEGYKFINEVCDRAEKEQAEALKKKNSTIFEDGQDLVWEKLVSGSSIFPTGQLKAQLDSLTQAAMKSQKIKPQQGVTLITGAQGMSDFHKAFKQAIESNSDERQRAASTPKKD